MRDFRSLAVTSQRYLNRAHLEDPTGGCPSAALLPEIARQPLSTRKDYEKGLRSYVATLAALLPDADASASRRRATAIFGLMVGTLQFARAVPNAAQASAPKNEMAPALKIKPKIYSIAWQKVSPPRR